MGSANDYQKHWMTKLEMVKREISLNTRKTKRLPDLPNMASTSAATGVLVLVTTYFGIICFNFRSRLQVPYCLLEVPALIIGLQQITMINFENRRLYFGTSTNSILGKFEKVLEIVFWLNVKGCIFGEF